MTFHDVLIVIEIVIAIIGIGSAFALGFALMCKLLEWAPINMTININNYPKKEEDRRS